MSKIKTALEYGLTPIPAARSLGRSLKSLATTAGGYARRREPKKSYADFSEMLAGRGATNDDAIKAVNFLVLKMQWCGGGFLFGLAIIGLNVAFGNYIYLFSLPFTTILYAVALKSAFLADVYHSQNLNKYPSVAAFLKARGLIKWLFDTSL